MTIKRQAIGRPSKLSRDITQIITQNLQLGMTLSDAAVLAGVCRSTIHRWRERGEKDAADGRSTEYAAFCNDLLRAEIKGKQSLLAVVRSAAKTDWKAARWLLQCKYPDEYSSKAIDLMLAQKAPTTTEQIIPPLDDATKAAIDEQYGYD